jgi:hypothetical protein
MDNQQLYSKNAKLQLILSAYLGDGHLRKDKKSLWITNTIKGLVQFKANLVGKEIHSMINKGYGNKLLYTLYLKDDLIRDICNNSLKENLNLLDDLGIALWFYDDGSLHKTKLFYNLCTHAFDYEEHVNILVPFFKSRGITPVIRTERKKDGRLFYYLSFNKLEGAPLIANILKKWQIEGLEYKLWSSETIQKWSTLQEQWKSEDHGKPFKIWARGKI